MQVDLATVEYAGFWSRLLASVLDSILQAIVFTPVMIMFFGTEFLFNPERETGFGEFFVGNVLPAIAVILFWKYKSATPGKIMMGIAIVDARTGGDPSVGRLVLRFFGYIVSMLPLFLGFFWIAFDRRKQGWHDKIADTLVVKLPPKG
jgi:uncharacterized RDD family membrane protein YckC